MKVFLDTNILLDVLNASRPCWAESSAIVEIIKCSDIEAVVTTQSIVDAYYIAPKHGSDRATIDSFISWLTIHFNVRYISDFDVRSALCSCNPDFEDAVQVACADAEGCDVFLTGDKTILSSEWNTSMLFMSPQQFVDKMRRQ